MRRLLHPLWVLLALIFLAEAWLWEHLEPIVARLVAWVPLRAMKAWLADRVAHLSPPATLLVFVVPVVVLFPLKLVAVWMIAHGHWLGALATLLAAKLIGVGVAAFIFEVTRPKLMQMVWFAQVYAVVMRVRDWAHEMTMPARQWLLGVRSRVFAGDTPRWLRRLRRTRRRLLATR